MNVLLNKVSRMKRGALCVGLFCLMSTINVQAEGVDKKYQWMFSPSKEPMIIHRGTACIDMPVIENCAVQQASLYPTQGMIRI